MYNLPTTPIDEKAAEASLSITGFSFQTRAAPPPMWGSVTGYGADHIPWWIQKEMIEKKDRKITRLEAQVEQYKKEIEQMSAQMKCYQATNAMLAAESKSRNNVVESPATGFESITEKCSNSINKLDVIIRRMETIQRDMVELDTSRSTRFIILKLNELENLEKD